MKKYVFFWGGPFSNWQKANFSYKGRFFTSSEQALMWAKAMLFNDIGIADKILSTNNVKRQKELGREVKGYIDSIWSINRYAIMYDILEQKFLQNIELRIEILSHPGSTFVEASPVDTIWGIGMAEGDVGIEDESNWKGQNLLGKALTQVRDHLEWLDCIECL